MAASLQNQYEGANAMEKVIYENESGKLTASAEGGVVTLTQELQGELIGQVAMYYEEVAELNDFISSLLGSE
jgi:hypothetical protein